MLSRLRVAVSIPKLPDFVRENGIARNCLFRSRASFLLYPQRSCFAHRSLPRCCDSDRSSSDKADAKLIPAIAARLENCQLSLYLSRLGRVARPLPWNFGWGGPFLRFLQKWGFVRAV